MTPDADPEAPLRDDVRLLGALLGDVVRAREGDAVFETVERVRAPRQGRAGGRRRGFETLRAGVLGTLLLDEALPVARAFAHFLTLANIAEQHHRIRRRRALPARPRARRRSPARCDETFGPPARGRRRRRTRIRDAL